MFLPRRFRGPVALGWRSVSLVLSLPLRKSPPPDHGRAVGSRRRAPHSYFSCGRGQEGRLSEPELQGRRDRVSGFKWWCSQFATPARASVYPSVKEGAPTVPRL